MPDWFLFLTPLLVLLIALLFIFVGCGLNIKGTARTLLVEYKKSVVANVKSIKVFYTYDVEEEASSGSVLFVRDQTGDNAEELIDPNGGVFSIMCPGSDGEDSYTCECSITMLDDPNSKNTNKAEVTTDQGGVKFRLVRAEDNQGGPVFSLEV